jgi:hypothetical protein
MGDDPALILQPMPPGDKDELSVGFREEHKTPF